jgi:flagellar P-ring protein precursor FlgI
MVCIRLVVICISACALFDATANAQQTARIKDITTIYGENENVLTGFGLVSGLAGTGGTGPTTKLAATNALQKLGLRSDPSLRENIQRSQDKTDNLSVVMVRAVLPPNYKEGQKIDVIVATQDNAKSLQGGILAETELSGPDGVVYAIASGPISTNGGEFGGQAATVTKNHPSTGRIPRGGQVVAEVRSQIFQGDVFHFNLIQPDYGTAENMSRVLNQFAPRCAIVEDQATVSVRLPPDARSERFRFLSECQQLTVEVNSTAKVIINERTGTIVMGGDVKLSKVAITHGNLIVRTVETPQVSQPAPFSDGETTVVPRTSVDVTEEGSVLNVIEPNTTVGDLAASLNALGASPRDLSVILQMLRQAGTLHAEIEMQ